MKLIAFFLFAGLCQVSATAFGQRETVTFSRDATLADILHHRDLSQERHIHLLGQVLHTFLPEEEVTLVGMLGWSEP